MNSRAVGSMTGVALIVGMVGCLNPVFSAGAQAGAAEAADRNGASFQTITSEQLASMLSRKDFVFVNVHVPYEGEIKATDALIPYDRIAENLDKLPKDKNAKIVLYCRSGRMSEIAADKLVEMGYTHVAHLAGGMNAWKQTGREILEK